MRSSSINQADDADTSWNTYEDGTVENFKYPAQIWRK
jgi:hypothetical protein